MEQEEWRTLVLRGEVTTFQVSNMGRLKNLKTGNILKPYKDKYGYLKHHINGKNYLIHRLVMMAFVPNPNNYPQVNHLNGIKTDNRLENLEWCDASRNMRHSIEIGLRTPESFSHSGLKGEDNPTHKYSEEEFMKCNEEIMNLQTQLEVARDEEKHLIEGRNCLERRVHSLDGLVKKVGHMAMAIGSVMSYLNQTINEAADRVEEAEKNKGLGARIIEAQEHERFRLAREIHDGPAQDMANLIFMTSVAEKLADKDPEECKKTIKDFREQVRSSLSDIRQVIFDMRPMSLDDLGLAPAVRQLSQKLVERETLRTVDFEVQGEEYPVAKHVETAVFRIVQEALNNVAHHSGTDSAKVRIVYASNAVSIVIEDNGKKFTSAIKSGVASDVGFTQISFGNMASQTQNANKHSRMTKRFYRLNNNEPRVPE